MKNKENPRTLHMATSIVVVVVVVVDDDGDDDDDDDNYHSSTTEKLQQYTDLKEELIRICQLKTAYLVPQVLPTAGVFQTNYTEF